MKVSTDIYLAFIVPLFIAAITPNQSHRPRDLFNLVICYIGIKYIHMHNIDIKYIHLNIL